MNRIFRSVVVAALFAASAVVLAPASPAHAASSQSGGGWASYLWKKSGTCVFGSSGDYADGPSRVKVRKVSAKKVETRTSDGSVTSMRVTRLGRLLQRISFSGAERDLGFGMTVRGKALYPTVAQARAGKAAGTSQIRFAITWPEEVAPEIAQKGRTTTLIGRFRSRGLGEKRITLPVGTVTAIGIRSELTNFATVNVRPRARAEVRSIFRSVLAELSGEEWWAPGRGQVQVNYGPGESEVIQTLRRCG